MRFYLTLLFISIATILLPQQKKVLFVAIDQYPSTSGWSKINSDNDVLMLQSILEDRGFKSYAIQNESATKAGILNSLDMLIKNSQMNDTIIIHFSTHGQQVLATTPSGSVKLREALIPYDAEQYYKKGNYEGEKHLLDNELGVYLKSIREKIGAKGVLFVNIDSCHSGDAVRAAGDNAPVRGTNAVFTDDPFFIRPNKKDVVKNRIIPHEANTAHHCVVYACQSYQNNYELKVDDMYYGSLSYAFYLTLKNTTSDNPLEWAKGIVREMDKSMKRQNPYFESTFIF